MKVNLCKTKVMVSGGITKDGMSKSNVSPCGFCSLRVKDNSVLCVQCAKWIHGRCAGVKWATVAFLRNFTCRKCEVNIGEAVEHEEKLYNEVETVRAFTYLGDWVSTGGGCEAAVTARTRCGWVNFGECGELLSFIYPLRLIGAVYRSYVGPAILCGSEAWCL